MSSAKMAAILSRGDAHANTICHTYHAYRASCMKNDEPLTMLMEYESKYVSII